ncbi:hypothetical protein Tco_0902611, partial [Tanacetum coccineum]
MSSETKLTKDEDGESFDNTKYRGRIGSLLYVKSSGAEIMVYVDSGHAGDYVDCNSTS